MAPRKHAVLIHAFADGAEIEFKSLADGWRPDKQPLFLDDCEYRLKPAAAAYPETTMSGIELFHVWRGGRDERASDMRAIANAALRHAIDTGLVAPKEAYDQVNTALAEAERRLGRCEARDLAVAEAVRAMVLDRLEKAATAENFQGASALNSVQRTIDGISLHAIIASVP